MRREIKNEAFFGKPPESGFNPLSPAFLSQTDSFSDLFYALISHIPALLTKRQLTFCCFTFLRLFFAVAGSLDLDFKSSTLNVTRAREIAHFDIKLNSIALPRCQV